jgi:hypothetical protein
LLSFRAGLVGYGAISNEHSAGVVRELAADQVAGLDNAWASAGQDGTGLLLTPATRQALATWIATGHRPTGIDRFARARFA